MNRTISFAAVALLIAALGAASGTALVVGQRNRPDPSDPARHITLKLGHALDQQHPVHKAMVLFADRLDELSSGAVTVDIIPNGQLGSETELLEQVQHGALAMTKVSTAPLESFVPEMSVFGLPYLFRDEPHFWAVLEGPIGKELLAKGAESGLRGLCYYDAGARSFYTVNRPILKPDDLQGLKIRVQASPTSMEMVETLGGSPTPISFGELYSALQQKMVDGAENNPPSFHKTRHFEVCKHYSLDEHTRVPDLLLVNEELWQQLPPQVQQWIEEAIEESVAYERELWQKDTRDALEAVQKEGVTIHYPDKTLFADKAAPMLQAFNEAQDEASERIAALIARIQEVTP
ncbi:MAG: TRAP transporter substrate-binding protein DctP [Planctomycetaceae bacterium]|nr:TRAP transporter substrate-binding protein DctP [Planctomycetaceae bacterium]